MGSGASALSSDVPGGELRLPATGLRFSYHQLRALNSYVDALQAEDQQGRMSTETESAVESLVQKIVDGAGQRDPRFRCCHLIALHRGKKMRSRSLEYLVTLDSLPVLNSSEDCRLQEGPVGYGKIRLTGREADMWEEFLTPSGYLCRDKVVEKWVELIARCAHLRGGGGGARVLCARAAARALPYRYCYLERATSVQAPQERRLAIVEGAAWVVVRVGAGEAGAKLVLGARVAGVSAAAYTTRVPLAHPLALLHYTSAQQGYYAVAVGPPSDAVCGERASTWQLRAPAQEAALDAHHGPRSPAARLAAALNALVDRMRAGTYKGSLKYVSRYMAWCVLRRRLDWVAAHAPGYARSLPAAHTPHHLLLLLDTLVSLCESSVAEGAAGCVWAAGRGARARGGARAAAGGAWAADAGCVRACLHQLQQIPGEDIPPTPSESLELALFNRWENLNKEWKASAGPAPTFTRRQLRYLWRVTSELIACKNMVVMEGPSAFVANLLSATSSQRDAEHTLHVLAILLDQARDHHARLHANTHPQRDRELTTYRSKKWNKLKEYYDASSACLIDAARREAAGGDADVSDPLTLMAAVIRWLQRGAKDDKKYLGPVLKPYLDALFATSMENSFFLDEFEARQCEKEFEGLKEYCLGVHAGRVEARDGLLQAADTHAWAGALCGLLRRYRHLGECAGLKEYCLGVHAGRVEARGGLLQAADTHAWAGALCGLLRRYRHLGECAGLKEYCLGVHAGRVEARGGLLQAADTHAWAGALCGLLRRYRHLGECAGLKEYCLGVHAGRVEARDGLLQAADTHVWAGALCGLLRRYRHLGECAGLKEYCLGVHAGHVEARDGLLQAADTHVWAGALCGLLRRYRHLGECAGLKEYCLGVHAGRVEARDGLLQAADTHAWAGALCGLLRRYRHLDFRLVFPTGSGLAVSYEVRVSRGEAGVTSQRALTLSRRDKAEAKLRLATRSVLAAFADALEGDRYPKPKDISRQGSEEILTSVKNGNFWRNATKPDVIPSTSSTTQHLETLPRSRRRSRRTHSTTSHGFPEISITSQADTKTMRRKYHTLRSLVYNEPVETIKEMRQRPRSAGSTVRNKAMSRPSLLETLDFINSVKDALCVEESGVSDLEEAGWGAEEEWVVGLAAPLSTVTSHAGVRAHRLALADTAPALLAAGKFTVLQELCAWLAGGGEGALFALHRLARHARSRSSERVATSWRLPGSEAAQQYRARAPDEVSGDDAPTPPPLPRRSSKEKMTKHYSDYLPPKRLQDLEQHLDYLEKVNSRLNLSQSQKLNDNYTGIINPIYDIKIPRDKFSVKRSKSLGRSFSTKHLGLEITRYNITLGRQSGKKTNDVITAINGTTSETGLESKSNFFQRNTTNVVGDSYKVSRVTID